MKSQREQKIGRIRDALQSLPVMDDLYLRMQALNIELVDAYLSDMEHYLLQEYMEVEKTPIETTLMVSALSQLWIFGLYELLRTWRQRAADILHFAEKLKPLDQDSRKKLIAEKKREIKSSVPLIGSESFYWPPYEKMGKNLKFATTIRNAIDISERLFRRIEALRVSLAKHEIPKGKGAIALAPGYGRIDMSDGSIYWQVVLEKNEIDLVSRRTIADDCRALLKKRPSAFLSKAIQDKIATFPRHGYGVKLVTVILKDGTEYKNVMVAWSREVVHVLNYEKVPFDARKVVEARYDKINND
jgi:hypothetical protein